MSKIITDENKNELDTSQEEKITENYALEILGLKDIADFRKFSRSFMKLDKIVKDLENNTTTEFNKKLNKGENLETEYDTAVKIVTELKKKQNKEDSTLKTVVKTIVGAINELFTNKLEKGGYSGTAQNLLTEISKIASKSILGRIIIGKGLSVDSSGRTSIVSKNDGITINESDIQLNTVDNVVTDSGTKPLSARQGKKLEENKQNKNDSTLLTVAKTIVGAINELFNNKLEKGGYSGNAKNLNDELSKKASKSILGRMIVGDNLTVDSNGRVSANPPVDISGKLEKGGLPAKISDAKGLYDLIESNSGLNFDTALLYLNDAGTKYVNKIYFDRNKKGLFKCISQTTSTTNSTSYFVDISNEANSAQLRNMSTLGLTLSENLIDTKRKPDVTYTNNSDKYILIYVYGQHKNRPTHFYLNDILVSAINGYGDWSGGFFIVPPRFTYKLDSNGLRITHWYEVR